MTTSRLEAFSDGVLAIIITIMVLDLKVPLGDGLMSLKPYIPKFLNYLISFVYVGIYWNNHHHLSSNQQGKWSSFVEQFTLIVLVIFIASFYRLDGRKP